MKVQPECVPCLLRRVLYETALVDEDKSYDTLKAAMQIMNEDFSEHINSARLATKIHGQAYNILQDKDPYKEMKKKSNEFARKLYPRAEKIVADSDNPFRSAVICSIVGNVLDFGIDSPIKSPDELFVKFDELHNEGLGHDDTEKIKSLLSKSSRILYFADNCGEIVFDTLLLKELRKYDIHLTIVVRGEPILTDATMDDVKELGLAKLVDDVETTNVFAVGVDVDRITPKLKKKLESADLTISKGMANWESFSDEDYRPIAYLLRTKCAPVARGLGVLKGMNIAKLYE